MGKRKKPDPCLWQIELHTLTLYKDPVILYFVALAEDGETALDFIHEEHGKELVEYTIEKELFEPLGRNSLFIDVDVP